MLRMVSVQFAAISKVYKIHHDRPRSFQEALVDVVRLRKKNRRELFWALRDLNLSINSGETVGLIGPNGSGKSSVLKLIAGIIEPTLGKLRISGRVAGLLEV